MGIITAIIAVVAQRNLKTVKMAEYRPKSMQSPRQSKAEGLYWELKELVTLSDSVETGRYSNVSDILPLLPKLGASFYYSFKDNAVLGLQQVDDPSYAISLWKNGSSGDFDIFEDMLPYLEKEYFKYQLDKNEGRDYDDFRSLCSSVGMPFPSIAVTSYDWFEYNSTSIPSSPALEISYVDDEQMDLTYKDQVVLHYVRNDKLPYEIAPITMYFQEKEFFLKNQDKLEGSSWTPSSLELQSHFREAYNSKKH